jgi:putative hydrolase of the HAD superfamily
MGLRAVIFDFGGVLVRTRDQVLRRRWEQHLGLAAGGAAEIVFGGESGRAAQLGQISDAQHWQWIQGQLRLGDEDIARFRRDFFARDELDRDLLAYLARLRSRYHLGLLSNASSVARRLFAEHYGLLDTFDSVTISCEEGIMKPDVRIFTLALTRARVDAHEALFVDDFLENVEAAQRLGIQTVHFRHAEVSRRELEILTGIV